MPWKLKLGLNLFALFFVFVGSMAAVGGVRLFREWRKLEADGVVVPGQVVGSRVKPGDRNDDYYLTVAYHPAVGPGISREIEVSKWKFDAANQSRTVDVRYLASDPKVADVAGDTNKGFMPLFMATVFLGFGGYCLYVINIMKPDEDADPGYTIE